MEGTNPVDAHATCVAASVAEGGSPSGQAPGHRSLEERAKTKVARIPLGTSLRTPRNHPCPSPLPAWNWQNFSSHCWSLPFARLPCALPVLPIGPPSGCPRFQVSVMATISPPAACGVCPREADSLTRSYPCLPARTPDAQMEADKSACRVLLANPLCLSCPAPSRDFARAFSLSSTLLSSLTCT